MVRTILAVVVGLVLVVATAAFGGYLLLGGDLGNSAATDRSADSDRSSPSTTGGGETEDSAAGDDPEADTSPDAESASAGDRPAQRLRRLAERDESRVRDRAAGSWVVQLSATPRSGRRAAIADALGAHRRLRQEYGGVLLLDSTAWGAARPGHWVTVLGRPYDAPAGALRWCRSRDLPSGDCFARELRTDGSWESNIDLWPPGAG